MEWLFLVLFLFSAPWQNPAPADSPSEARLTEGHYRLTVTVEDTTRGRGVADVEVEMKLRRGFLILGRKKKDLAMRTNADGQVIIHGLPAGKVDLKIAVGSGRPQEYEADLQPTLRNRVELHTGPYAITLEWKLL